MNVMNSFRTKNLNLEVLGINLIDEVVETTLDYDIFFEEYTVRVGLVG